MIPLSLLDEVVPAKSYGLMESIGGETTDIDHDDDLDYWLTCRDVYSAVLPDGRGDTQESA